MKINCIYFSPTGGTKKVVERIASAWKEDAQKVDLSLALDERGSFRKDELCIIGVPSFGGRVPAVATERILQLKADATPTILVAVFGNRAYDDTLLELKDTVSQSGFHVVAAIAAVAEHSVIRSVGAGRPNADDQKELHAYAQKIKQALQSGKELQTPIIPGNTPYRKFGGLPLKPSAGKSCTKCGLCAKSCPVHAIPATNPSDTQKDLCITCMRCVAICPAHARRLNPVMLFAASKKMEKSCATPQPNELYIAPPVATGQL